TNPIIEAVLTMVPPPCLSIWRISYFMHNHTPLRLIPRTRSQVSSVHSWGGARGGETMPALLWAQSNLPYVSTALLIMASTARIGRTGPLFTRAPSTGAALAHRRDLQPGGARCRVTGAGQAAQEEVG